jgi:hypothetical protein
MSQPSIARIALTCAVALSLGTTALAQGSGSVKVTPASHDFGKETVGKTAGNPEQFFAIQLPPGAGAHDTVALEVIDPTQENFKVDEGPSFHPATGMIGPAVLAFFICDSTSISSALTGSGINGPAIVAPANPRLFTPGICYLRVWFQPTSPGPKTGTIRVYEIKGGRWTSTTITLRGTGVGGGCVYTVVQGCNYAPLYYGTFTWTHTITSPTSSYAEDVRVDVLGEEATCNVTAKGTGNGNTSTGTVVAGKGLIAVEFIDKARNPGTDSTSVVYRISVACPSPAYPATEFDAATPSRPADLGDFSQETYEQRVKAIGLDLIGTISQPAPETDPINNVGGRLELHWSLKRR